MYIQQLYKHNKWLCILIILFAAVQVINNLRQDVAISPVYVYGMYSQVMKPDTAFEIPEIFVDGQQLHTAGFSPYEWEKVAQPVMLFKKQYVWNNRLYDDYISRLLHTQNKKLYINTTTQQQFDAWYKSYLENCLHKKISEIRIQFITYKFNGKELIRTANAKDE